LVRENDLAVKHSGEFRWRSARAARLGPPGDIKKAAFQTEGGQKYAFDYVDRIS